MRIAVALLFLGITTAYSQTQSVDPHKSMVFSGSVTDVTGALIPKATLSLETNKSSALQTTADEVGYFTIEGRPGEYTLKVASRGFATYIKSIHLVGTDPIKQNFVLEIDPSYRGCGPCVVEQPKIELLDASLTATIPLNPLPPLKLHKHIAR